MSITGSTTLMPCLKHYNDNERDGILNHRRLDCLLNPLFGRRSKKTSKLRVTGLCEGNWSVTGEFLAQRVSNAENIFWRHNGISSTGPRSWNEFQKLDHMARYQVSCLINGHQGGKQHFDICSIIFLMKFSSLAALEVVILSTSSSASY